jgi:uncharacterized secreted protein with C-terminal beta-propeller domain
MDDDRRRVRRGLEQLAERGTPRGAAEVLTAARRRSGAAGSPARAVSFIAIAASVLLIAGVAGALVVAGDDRPAERVAGPTTTEPAPTTTEPVVTTTAAPVVTAPPVTVPARVVAASRLKPFGSSKAFLAYVKPKGIEVVGPGGLPGYGRSGVGYVPPPPGQEGGVTAQVLGASGGGEPFSTTNAQEEGIDEPDIAKTDGRTIFSLENGVLRAVSTSGTPSLVGALPVPDVYEFLLVGDRVVALGARYPTETAYDPHRLGPQEYPVKVVVAVIDVSRPSAMRLLSRMEIEGTYVSARLVGGAPRIVVQSYPDLAFPAWTEATAEAAARATDENRAVIQGSTVDPWIPSWTMTEGPNKGRSGPLVSFDQVYRPPSFAGFGMLSVMTLDPGNPQASNASSVMGDGTVVYSSATRMYVAGSQWGPLQQPALTVEPVAETLVHAFDVSAPTESTYRNSGKVRGHVKDQFSFSEHDGNLRVVSTEGAEATETFVSVLADQVQALVQVGQVGGLGRGEVVYGVRFIGAFGYVVTFRQVDPLYVLDLTDPTKPRVRGQLKIPGFSRYLHPVGDGLLLGVGQDANEEGRVLGIQVSLFDISNPDAPKRIQQHQFAAGGSSPVEFDHHAFLYWAPTELAVLPINIFNEQYNRVSSDAVGVKVARGAITEVGRVTHPSRTGDESPPYIYRSIVIGDRLYTVSNVGVRQSNLATFAAGPFVSFR